MFNFLRRRKALADHQPNKPAPPEKPSGRAQVVEVDISPDDPLLAYFIKAPGVVEIERLNFDSPALHSLKQSGIKIAVPLVSQGELIGVLNLGPRLSEQEYSSDDRRLLQTLATQAAPALRVAQLARQQQAQAMQRERLEHELRVARIVQETLLPKQLPQLDGWKVSAHWQPARAVSGDFYDFIAFPDGRLGLVVADVTDKGIPAALVMAASRSVLRSTAEVFISPGQVLEQANNQLCINMPPNMFVTCLYIVIDPPTGHLWFANAGHNLPYQCVGSKVVEMRARGMPLGLMPDMTYEEFQADLLPGDRLILYSDGLVEAHNPDGEMFGFPRLRNLIGSHSCEVDMIHCLLLELGRFTGEGWEQEDDVTIVSVERFSAAADKIEQEQWRMLARFRLPSEAGNERLAMERVAEIALQAGYPADRLERLKTGVAEATMNAIEYGNRYQADIPVWIEVLSTGNSLMVRIQDQGGGHPIPEPEIPDLDAKLRGLQSPRGWGLFLIQHMVDEVRHVYEHDCHIIELIVNWQGGAG